MPLPSVTQVFSAQEKITGDSLCTPKIVRWRWGGTGGGGGTEGHLLSLNSGDSFCTCPSPAPAPAPNPGTPAPAPNPGMPAPAPNPGTPAPSPAAAPTKRQVVAVASAGNRRDHHSCSAERTQAPRERVPACPRLCAPLTPPGLIISLPFLHWIPTNPPRPVPPQAGTGGHPLWTLPRHISCPSSAWASMPPACDIRVWANLAKAGSRIQTWAGCPINVLLAPLRAALLGGEGDAGQLQGRAKKL